MTDTEPAYTEIFGPLGDEIAHFANHTRKLLKASQRHRTTLLRASEWSEGVAPLATAPDDPNQALKAIDQFARSQREDRPKLFGAYFAHHHLRIQAELSVQLTERLAEAPREAAAGIMRDAYEEATEVRTRWIAALLDRTLKAAAPDLNARHYAALNVGSLTDHEDVDLAIVVSSRGALASLDRGFAVVARTFLRFASKIQLYLTEQFAASSSAALVSEYEALLRAPKSNVAAITQLLSATRLAGNPRLAQELESRVVARYYSGQGDPLLHEAYLRAVMKELQHFLAPSVRAGRLAPKREIYLPLKLTIAGLRTIYKVHATSPVEALAQLARADPKHGDAYEILSDTFVQNEILRALLFLYVVRTDEIDLSDPATRTATRHVARRLALPDSARRTAEERLLGRYADVRGRALTAAATLSLEIARHLHRISAFRNLIGSGATLQRPGINTARRLLELLTQHRGPIFWNEVIDTLGGDRNASRRFTDDLLELSPTDRGEIAKAYIACIGIDAEALIEFLAFVGSCDRNRAYAHPESSGKVSGPFWRAAIDAIRAESDAGALLRRQFFHAPAAESIFRLASSFAPAQLGTLCHAVEAFDAPPSILRLLRSMIILVHHRSRAVGRVVTRVLARTPEFLERTGDVRLQIELAQEISARAAREPIPEEQVELFGDAYDVAQLSGAIFAILEGEPKQRDELLTRATDRYVRELFKACFRDVRTRSPTFAQFRPGDGIALFVTGGYGRGEAFGADWDYVAVVADQDPRRRKFFGKVLQRVSGAMTRRGLLPHNRFTDRFNAYAVTIPELEALVADRDAESFIDEAELLECRFLLGDASVAADFQSKVVDRIIRQNGDAFVRDILAELRDRRQTNWPSLNLKLGPGGLRELHLLRLGLRVAKAVHPESLVDERLSPEILAHRRALPVVEAEIRRARDLYRLSVAFDDHLDLDALLEVSRDLSPLAQRGFRAGIRAHLEKLMRLSSTRIDHIAALLERIVAPPGAEAGD